MTTKGSRAETPERALLEKKVRVRERRVMVKIRKKRKRPYLPTKSRGLPLLRKNDDSTTQEPASKPSESSNPDDNDDNDDDNEFFQSLPSDTVLILQALRANTQTCLLIPSTANGADTFLRAVLECQVHARLRNASRDLHDLTGWVRLREAAGCNGLVVLLTVHDYERGVRDALDQFVTSLSTDDDQQQQQQASAAVDWFLRHLPDWTRQRTIGQDDFGKAYYQQQQQQQQQEPQSDAANKQKTTVPLAQVLTLLTRMQVLLPTDHHQAHQLWLPEWGRTVLKAWHMAQTRLLAHIRSSYYGERSMNSCTNSSSAGHAAIPTRLLVEWLTAQGVVQEVVRPSGTFLQLARQKVDGMIKKNKE